MQELVDRLPDWIHSAFLWWDAGLSCSATLWRVLAWAACARVSVQRPVWRRRTIVRQFAHEQRAYSEGHKSRGHQPFHLQMTERGDFCNSDL